MSGRDRPRRGARVNYSAMMEQPKGKGKRGRENNIANEQPTAQRARRVTNLNVSGNNGGLLIGPNMYFLKNLILRFLQGQIGINITNSNGRTQRIGGNNIPIWNNFNDKQKGSWATLDFLLYEVSNNVLQQIPEGVPRILTDEQYMLILYQIWEQINENNIYKSTSPLTLTIDTNTPGGQMTMIGKIVNSWLDGSHDEYITLSLSEWINSDHASTLYPTKEHRDFVIDYFNDRIKFQRLQTIFNESMTISKKYTSVQMSQQLNNSVKGYYKGQNKNTQDKLRKLIRVNLETKERKLKDIRSYDYIEKLIWFCPQLFDGIYTNQLKTGTFERHLKLAMPTIFGLSFRSIPPGRRLTTSDGRRIYLGVDQEEKTAPLSSLVSTSNRNIQSGKRQVGKYINLGLLCDPGAMLVPTGIIQDVRGIASTLTGGSPFSSQMIYEVGPFQLQVKDQNGNPFEMIDIKIVPPAQTSRNRQLTQKTFYINFTLNGFQVNLTSTKKEAKTLDISSKIGKQYGDRLPGLMINVFNRANPKNAIRALGTGDGINIIDTTFTSLYFFGEMISLFVDYALPGSAIDYFGEGPITNANRITQESPTTSGGGVVNRGGPSVRMNNNRNYLRQSGVSNNSRINAFKAFLGTNQSLRARFNRLKSNNPNSPIYGSLQQQLISALAEPRGINYQALKTILSNASLNPAVANEVSAMGGNGGVATGGNGGSMDEEEVGTSEPRRNNLTQTNIAGSFVNTNRRLTNQTIKNRFYQAVSEQDLAENFRALKVDVSEEAEDLKDSIIRPLARGDIDLAIRKLRTY